MHPTSRLVPTPAPAPRLTTRPARSGEAGLTLVEVLVVLALIGVLTGGAVLSFGSGAQRTAARDEGTRLAARLDLAAQTALLSAAPVSFTFDEREYGFEVPGEDGWTEPDVSALAPRFALADGVSLEAVDAQGAMTPTGATRGFVIDPDLVPVSGEPVTLLLATRGGPAWRVVFDGFGAELLPPGDAGASL